MRKDDRLLSPAEQALLALTRQPGLKSLSDDDLLTAATELRKSRNIAREIRKTRRRSRVGPALGSTSFSAPGEAGGVGPKVTLLVGAIRRVNKEIERRLLRKKRGSAGTVHE